MKTKTTLLKVSLLALFLFISTNAWSAIYYTCNGSSLNLSVPAITGINYMWDVKDLDGTTSLSGYPRAGVPTSLPTVAGNYKVFLSSTQADPNSGICAPDVVENTIIVLPSLSMVLNAPTHASYCAANSTVSSSDITLTNAITLPSGSTADLELEYTYSVNNGTATVDGSTIGSIDPLTGKFTLNTVVAGTYIITGTVKYKQKTGFTNALLGTTGCVTTSTTAQTITVTPKPTAPVITITAS